MKRFCLAPVPIALALAFGLALADEGHHHPLAAGEIEKLGKVHFPVSCGAAIQSDFDRAVALLHSFQYEDAERAFLEIAKRKPSCGMAYWGAAMSNYHPLWESTPKELERGRSAAAKAKQVGARTELEKDWLAAIGAFYEGEKVDLPTRRLAFEKAMQGVHERHPDDLEVTIFYALAIRGTASPTDRTYAKSKKAAEILNAVLPKAPDHPGVAHYLIHSLDYPELASLALPAARAYAKIAPSSPHAQHMPSHIFTQLGLWDESIQSNLASARAARALMARNHPGATHYDELHAMDYLAYAYLQLGQEEQAKGVLDSIRKVQRVDQESFSAAYAFAAIPARFALERHHWTEAAALQLSPSWFGWSQFPWAEAVTHFARGIGAARSGDLPSARSSLARLDTLHEALVGTPGYNWADQIEVQRLAVSAWIAHTEKRDEEAIQKLRSAADLEESIAKHPVTPGAVLPAREQLGDLLLEVNELPEAGKAYERVLQSAPGRRNSIQGLERVKGKSSSASGGASSSGAR